MKQKLTDTLRGLWKELIRKDKIAHRISPFVALLLSLVAAGLVVTATGANALEAYTALFKGALGSVSSIKQTIRYTIPIFLLGLSFSVCSRGGFFAIGQEGQMYAAALLLVCVQCYLPHLPQPLMMILMVICGIVAAVVCALIPAITKHYFGVNEAMVFVMLNYISLLLVEYLFLHSPLRNPDSASYPKSIAVAPTISTVALYIGVIAILILFILLIKKSIPGYRLRMVGQNTAYAKASGLPVTQTILFSAVLGGGLAGLASISEVLGVYHVVYNNFASALGFKGVTVALLGMHNPLGMLFASLLLGALQGGSVMLSTTTDVSPEIVSVVEGFIMFFSSVNLAVMIGRITDSRKRRKYHKEERAAQ
ncbi:MAG: ABC transporter permease [Christensenellaceae bacterium]|jgi:simple sugar transport system permease protein|nr:ABC transporter permease [Christensenellaceae bacterium]